MAPTLNQDDIKLLKGIFAIKDDLKDFAKKEDLKNFATKDDLKSFASKKDLGLMKSDLIKIVSASERKIVKRVDFMINVLDKDLMHFAKEVDTIKFNAV